MKSASYWFRKLGSEFEQKNNIIQLKIKQKKNKI